MLHCEVAGPPRRQVMSKLETIILDKTKKPTGVHKYRRFHSTASEEEGCLGRPSASLFLSRRCNLSL